MSFYKNLNDIPIQFRQYEHNDISENLEEAVNKSNLAETKENIPLQNCLSPKDKIFIFLILAIFFDAI